MNLSSLLSRVKSPRTRRGRRLRLAAIIVLVYTIVGFFLAPALLKWQLLKRLPPIAHRQCSIQQVKLNPYAFSLTIRGLALTETNGQAFAGFDEFYGRFRLSSLFRWTWTFAELRLSGFRAAVLREADGQFNFANLLPSGPPPPPDPTHKASSLPSVLVQHLVFTNGNFTVEDRTRREPLRLEYRPVDLDLRDFTTRRNKNGRYSLAVKTGAGEHFEWSGTVSANPPESAGTFKLQGILLKTCSPYLSDFARAEVKTGAMDVEAEYLLNAGTDPIELEVTNARVKIAGFKLASAPGGEGLLALDSVEVEGASANLGARQVHVRSVAARGGSLLARREKDGQLNWLKLLVAPAAAQGTAVASASVSTNAPAEIAPEWSGRLDQFKLDDFSVTAQDLVPDMPAQIGLDALQVSLEGLSSQTNAPVKGTIAFNWRGGGNARIEVGGSLLPPAGQAKLEVTNLALPPIQPYVAEQARLVLNAGDLTVNGLASYSPDRSSEPVLQFTGDVSVQRFASIDTITYQDVAKWDALDLRGIHATVQSNTFEVAEIHFSRLQTSLVISSNGEVAAMALLKQPPGTGTPAEHSSLAAPKRSESGSSPSSAPSPSPVPELFPVKIGAVTFEKCSVRAADQSLRPRFDTSIEEFSGTIRDLAMPCVGKATVDIRGKVSALAPFEVSGTLTPDPKNPSLDLKLNLKNDDLTPFTPYTEKFAGHSLTKGKLTFDLSYKIENRKLEAANVVTIDQFTFGPRNASTNATHLPVKLAIALLKDRNGRISLDLPVHGSIDDPKFSISGLVWGAIENLLLKAAASPFSLLGGLFAKGEEPQFVDFKPGSSRLDAGQTNKLNSLVNILFQRPALEVEISPSADLVADRESLSLQELKDKMKSLRLHELASRGKPVPALADFQIDPSDYSRLLRHSYKEQFKIDPERALREARQAAAATNQPGMAPAQPAGGWLPAEMVKGDVELMRVRAPAAPKPQRAAQTTGANRAPAKPKTEQELVIEEMERRLMAAAPATDDDMRQMLTQRAQSVQKFLLASGKVSADRLFVVAPKAFDPALKTAARVTFSLE